MKIHLFLCLLILGACASPKKTIQKSLVAMEAELQDHTGFVLYDPLKEEYIIDFQGDAYFTPASNTKILTFYTALQTLPDSLPGLEYIMASDSLIFWGTGDPSLLYEELPASNVMSFLRVQSDTLFLTRRNYSDNALGPGWSWDDYKYSYSSERSDLPLYGNTFTMKLDSITGYLTTPQPFFRKFIWLGDSLEKSRMERSIHSNRTTYYPGAVRENTTFNIPFIYSQEFAARLLSDTLQKVVVPIEYSIPEDAQIQTVKSIPLDSALTVMMQQSDNFIAEQLLIMAADVVSDTLSGDIAIKYALENFMSEMPHPPQWVDGSGLSRYNLITPKSVVWLWDKLLTEFSYDRILPMLASGGGPGTLENWYVGNPVYVYGKTGTLSNNHNVSGLILTKKGNKYLFSFMNNNYPTSSTPVKQKMEQILQLINEKL